MRIGVVGGTGALGRAIALRLGKAGHAVVVGSREAERGRAAAAELAAETGGDFTGADYAGAATGVDVCFLAVPYAAQAETVAAIRAAAQGGIVVDTTAPLRPPKVGTVQLPATGSAAVETAAALGPEVRVVSALQTVGAAKLAAGKPTDADVLVAADDAEAAERVRALLADMGLRSWHVGPLANSAAAEALTSLMIQLNRRYKLGQAGIRVSGGTASPALSAFAVPGLPLFAAGNDLAAAIAEGLERANLLLQDGDVVVAAQKVVSKCEGRTADLAAVQPGEAAQELAARAAKEPAVMELLLAETQEVMRAVPGVVIARHRTGHVLANAGIDRSNVAPAEAGDLALLWPQDPDASARRLRKALEAATGARLAVIVSDSLGRAWRMGTTGHAIGTAGLRPLRDRRGEADLNGRELQSTLVAVADEIAAAASLVSGEGAEGLPVVIVRGAAYDPADDETGVAALLRPLAEDLFR